MPTKQSDSALTGWPLVEEIVRHALGSRVLLYGPPGMGKSYLGWEIARELGWNFFSVTMTDQTPAAEVRGHFVLKGMDSSVWHDGVFCRSWRASANAPTIAVINEINHASSDALSLLHNFLDDLQMAEMHLPSGEILKPHPEQLTVICTMNGEPEELPLPIRDRLSIQVKLTEPHPRALESIAVAELRALVARGELQLRSVKAFEQLQAKIGAPNAASAVWGAQGRNILASVQVAAKQ